MKLFLITQPFFFDGETALVNTMFSNGLETLHLRKPNATAAQLECFLLGIASEWLCRIVVHSHFELVGKFGLRGAHLGRGRSLNIDNFNGTRSFSCHSLQEVANCKPFYDYVFLSPVFDSISKCGYLSAFSETEMNEASLCGVIDSKVIALGGVCRNNIALVARMGFGGCAVLGDVWGSECPIERLRELLEAVREV